jgi:hypothetical protein
MLLNRLRIKSLRGKDASLSWKLEGRNDGQEFSLIASESVDFNTPDKSFIVKNPAAGCNFCFSL